MAQIGPEGLHREQVHGDCVAREGVEREDVEILRRLALERQPRVAERDLHLRRAVLEESEFRAGELDHRGVDVVEAEDVARPAVGRERPRAQAHHAHPQGRVLVRVEQREPDARSRPVVARGQAAPVRIQELLAVDDGAVREHPHRVRPLARIVHVEHAVEVARPDPGIGGILRVRPEQGDRERGRQREKYDPGGDSKASV